MSHDRGLLGALMGAGKRLLTGESLFMTVFLNRSGQKKRVAFGAPYPGKMERTLGPGEIVRVDTGCIVGFQPSVGYDIQFVGKIKSALFGGESLYFATLTGPGRIWLQSLPLSRLANRIIAAVPGIGPGGRREEGSLLGGLGGLLDGDNN